MRKTWTWFLLLVFAIPLRAADSHDLTGTVTNKTGALLQNASVTLYGGDRQWQATSDVEGRFHFTGVRPGFYDLRITLKGFQEATIEDLKVDDADPAPLTVTLKTREWNTCGAYVSPITSMRYLPSPGRASLKGTVHPGKKIRITLTEARPKGRSIVAESNRRGEFALLNTKPGEYVLTAAKRGYDGVEVPEVMVKQGQTLLVEFSMSKSEMRTPCE